jgi:hypothetical protein
LSNQESVHCEDADLDSRETGSTIGGSAWAFHMNEGDSGGWEEEAWTEDDMGRLKDHIRKHSLDSTTGEDNVYYMELLEISNEDLAYLANQCIVEGDGPTIWFKSALIGILKRMKPHYNPDSYRLIALESCFLKAFTMLIHWRISDWAEARALIPPWQNGFRPGYRTNNNPFILRCAKRWARAHIFTLYVAAVDATNAFPSTDQPTLWLKLFRLGAFARVGVQISRRDSVAARMRREEEAWSREREGNGHGD